MNQLIYIADPMCSWCHGFSPIMTRLADHYQNQLSFSIIMGGLRPGGNTPWDQKMKDFLRHHWEEVSARSGQPFRYDLLEKDVFNYDTEPSCRAVCIIKDMAPEKAFSFFKAIQHAFYFLNEDPNVLDFYLPLCDQFDIDKDEFSNHFSSHLYKNITQKDFQKSQSMGVRSFPTLLLQRGDSIHIAARGYASFEQIKERIDQVLSSPF